MDGVFNTIIRKGIQINMYREIEDLEAEYIADLQATINAYDSYDEIANETANDFARVEKVLRIFDRLGYLYHDEAEDMIQVAREKRLKVLEALSK